MTDERDFRVLADASSRLRTLRDQLESLQQRIIAQPEQTTRDLEMVREQGKQNEGPHAVGPDASGRDQTIPIVPPKEAGPTNSGWHWRSPEVWRFVGTQRALRVAIEQSHRLRQSVQRERLERQLKQLQTIRRQIVNGAKCLDESNAADPDAARALANQLAEYDRRLDDTEQELLSELRRTGVKIR